MTGGARSRLAVLGSPIAHSKSPALHAAAYRVLGFEADYGSVEVGSGMLGAFIEGLESAGDAGAGIAGNTGSGGGVWRGLSLTMPLKEEVLPLLDSVDRLGTLTGAANTVLFTPSEDGSGNGRARRDGFNTDVAGIVKALAGAGIDSAREVLVLGAGATARSAVVAAATLGAESVVIAARAPERAGTSVEVAHAAGLRVDVIPLSEALHGAIDAPVTISTLPGGALQPSDVAGIRPAPGAVLLDVAYAPWPSLLGTRWETAGGLVVSGLLMLVNQALMQVRVFVNGDPELVLPEEDAVLSAMLDAVGLPA